LHNPVKAGLLLIQSRKLVQILKYIRNTQKNDSKIGGSRWQILTMG
jgi:hypothetical protein